MKLYEVRIKMKVSYENIDTAFEAGKELCELLKHGDSLGIWAETKDVELIEVVPDPESDGKEIDE